MGWIDPAWLVGLIYISYFKSILRTTMGYFIGRAVRKIRLYDDMIHRVRNESPLFRDLIR